MTESLTDEQLAELFQNDAAEERLRQKRRRSRRIRMRHQKNDARLRVINYGGYAPHRGYVDRDFHGKKLLHSGAHIKYLKSSRSRQWMKRFTSRLSRSGGDFPKKGNHYRRLYDYWWNLY